MTRDELARREKLLLESMGRAIDELEVAAALAEQTGAHWLRDWIAASTDGLREIYQESQIEEPEHD